MLKVTISGSFHRHLHAITDAVYELTDLGLSVLSPSDPRIVAAHGEFLFVASDRVRSIRLVQDRHFDCIRASHFLWLVAPDGYVGLSAAMELGCAFTNGTPIFALTQPTDLTLRRYVRIVSDVRHAIDQVERTAANPPTTLLVDPQTDAEEAHRLLTEISGVLSGRSSVLQEPTGIHSSLSRLREIVGSGN
jgi:hypothetical protein